MFIIQTHEIVRPSSPQFPVPEAETEGALGPEPSPKPLQGELAGPEQHHVHCNDNEAPGGFQGGGEEESGQETAQELKRLLFVPL